MNNNSKPWWQVDEKPLWITGQVGLQRRDNTVCACVVGPMSTPKRPVVYCPPSPIQMLHPNQTVVHRCAPDNNHNIVLWTLLALQAVQNSTIQLIFLFSYLKSVATKRTTYHSPCFMHSVTLQYAIKIPRGWRRMGRCKWTRRWRIRRSSWWSMPQSTSS